MTKVTKYFDGNQRVAKMLLSDGVLINADDYASGLDGFIVAHWYGEHNDSLELEVPNSCLTEDHTIMKWDPKVNGE